MSTISNTLPDYRFVAASGLFPGIPDREVAAEQNSVNILNAKGASDFQNECAKWTSAATLARNNGETLPGKPISPPSWVVVSQDGQENGMNGKYIARTQGGPGYGVCSDLPPAAVTHPSNVTGLVVAGTPVQPTQDQKLDSIAASIQDLSERLKKAGV